MFDFDSREILVRHKINRKMITRVSLFLKVILLSNKFHYYKYWILNFTIKGRSFHLIFSETVGGPLMKPTYVNNVG
jgi:hypothetical protein